METFDSRREAEQEIQSIIHEEQRLSKQYEKMRKSTLEEDV